MEEDIKEDIKEGDIVVISNPICGGLLIDKEKHINIISIIKEIVEGACGGCGGHYKLTRLYDTTCYVCVKEIRKATDREKFLYYTHGSNALRDCKEET